MLVASFLSDCLLVDPPTDVLMIMVSERRQIIHNLVIYEGSQLYIQVKKHARLGTAPSGLRGEIRPRSNTLTPVLSSYWVLVAATHLIFVSAD